MNNVGSYLQMEILWTPPKSKGKTNVHCLLMFVRIHIFLWLHKTGLSSWLRVTDYWRPQTLPLRLIACKRTGFATRYECSRLFCIQ